MCVWISIASHPFHFQMIWMFTAVPFPFLDLNVCLDVSICLGHTYFKWCECSLLCCPLSIDLNVPLNLHCLTPISSGLNAMTVPDMTTFEWVIKLKYFSIYSCASPVSESPLPHTYFKWSECSLLCPPLSLDLNVCMDACRFTAFSNAATGHILYQRTLLINVHWLCTTTVTLVCSVITRSMHSAMSADLFPTPVVSVLTASVF